MRTLEEIRGRCRIEDGHWLWAGALWEGTPRIYAPDHNNGGVMRAQTGCRAVLQVKTGKAIPEGVRVFNTCGHLTCVRPACIATGSAADHGAEIAKTGRFKDQIHRILANRRNASLRRKVTPEVAATIRASTESQKAIAESLGLHEDTVGKVLRDELPLLRPLGGMFTQLVQAGSR